MFEVNRPSELVDLLAYLALYMPEFPAEDNCTTAEVFAAAWTAINRFIDHTPTEEGKERLRQCVRNLHVAFEMSEDGNDVQASQFVQETEQMFQRARKYIDMSDE
jgi:hypothetical protein